jgi:hypothetical protein
MNISNRLLFRSGVFRACIVARQLAILVTLLATAPLCRAQAGYPVVVNSIADLEAINTSTFTTNYMPIVFVSDYYPTSGSSSPAGRGGDHFRWLSGASLYPSGYYTPPPDYGRFVPCTNALGNTNGIWERLLEGQIANVKMWGAYGDGSHDDTTAIQNAINACWNGSVTWTAELRFPAGTYVVSKTLVFPSAVRLTGDMVANTEILMVTNADILETGNAESVLTNGPVNWDHWVQVENLKLYFQTATNTSNACLIVSEPGEANCIHNIETAGGGYGIRCLGAGAPGLRLRDVTVNGAAVAGVSIEELPNGTGGSGIATLNGISGDSTDDQLGIASLVKIMGDPAVEIDGLKSEGNFGSGVIQWICLPSDGSGPEGSLNIKHAGLATGGGTPNFLTLSAQSNTATQTPAVSLEAVINQAPNLIGDNVTSNYISPAFFAEGRLHMTYEGYASSIPFVTNDVGQPINVYNRCVVGNTAFSQFTPTNIGWYRVMGAVVGYPHLAGDLTISVIGFQSTKLDVDINPYTGTSPYLMVTRPTTAYSGGPSIPVVTQARAYRYWDSHGGYAAFVDIFVNVINEPVTLAHHIDGYEWPLYGFIQLISPVPWYGSNTNTNAYYPSFGLQYTNVLLYQ